MNKIKMNRKSFFKRIGYGGIGLSLLSIGPIKLLSQRKKINRPVNIKIHSSAVKRNS